MQVRASRQTTFRPGVFGTSGARQGRFRWTKDLAMKLSARCIDIAALVCLLAPLTAVRRTIGVRRQYPLSVFLRRGGDPALDRLP